MTPPTAADEWLSRHEGQAPEYACRCTLTVRVPRGQDIDDTALNAALHAIVLPPGYVLVDATVHPGWRMGGSA